MVLPVEDGAAFAALEAALIAEFAPVGVLQGMLVGRIARAAWRLERAERIEVEVFERRHVAKVGVGLALIRDGNGPRSVETVLRYRGAAQAELTRALRTLKALQAEQPRPVEHAAGPALGLEASGRRPATRASVSPRSQPIEPERRDACQLVSERGMPDEPESGRTVGQPAACWTPDEPDPREDPGDFRGDNAANEPRQRRLAASSIPLATPATASGRQESLASRPGARARTAGS